jgi:hypothetical protein
MLPSVFLLDLKNAATIDQDEFLQSEALRGLLLFYDIDRLESFGAFFNIETDCITFRQRPETVSLYGREVDKNIIPFIGGDEAKALCIVKPFY